MSLVTKNKETNSFSMRNVYRSIISPSSTGKEAAIEHIKNGAKKHINIVFKEGQSLTIQTIEKLQTDKKLKDKGKQ